MISRELSIGRAGQYIVLADLLTKGVQAFDTGEGVGYDVIAEVNGKLLKIQVKTTQQMRIIGKHSNPIYFFHLKRTGKDGNKFYQIGDFDLFALVALDRREVFYVPFDKKVSQNSVCIRDKNIKYAGKASSKRASGFYLQDLTWSNLLQELKP